MFNRGFVHQGWPICLPIAKATFVNKVDYQCFNGNILFSPVHFPVDLRLYDINLITVYDE